MNVKSSPKCEKCDPHCETISHIFYACPAVKIVWEKVTDWWNHKVYCNVCTVYCNVMLKDV